MARRASLGRGRSPVRGRGFATPRGGARGSPRGRPGPRGRARGGMSPRGRGLATPPRPPPPPPPPPPPASTDSQKAIFQDMVAKRISEWDKMMGASKNDERVKSFDLFKNISEEEVNLAHRNISRTRLKELSEMKMKYFDELAVQENPVARADSLNKFKETCDDEFALAKAVSRIQLDAPGFEVAPKRVYSPPQPPPQEMPYREYKAQMHPSYMMSQMLPRRTAEEKAYAPMDRRLMFGVQTVTQAPTEEDIDGRLRFLTQLESARGVLQNHPQGSSASMADEIKRRLRKINRMQMRVIDDILGAKGEDSTLEIASELRPSSSDLEADRHLRLAKHKYGTRPRDTKKYVQNIKVKSRTMSVKGRKIKPELRQSSDEAAVTTRRMRQAPKCTRTTEYCPPDYADDYEPDPEDLWGGPLAPGEHEHYYSPPDVPYYEPFGHGARLHQHDVVHYGGAMPHYHNQPPSPPNEMLHPHPAFLASTYTGVDARGMLDMPYSMGMVPQTQGVSNVGVEVTPSIDDPLDLPESSTRFGRKNPKFVSKTTIVVNPATPLDP